MDIKQYATEQSKDHRLNQKRTKKYLETNKTGTITYQNLWDAAKAVPGREFIVIGACLKKQKEA